MLKMKLPMKTGEEGGDEAAEDDSLGRREHRHDPRAASPSLVYERLQEWPKDLIYASQLDKETVFEWFGLHLNPAKRIEFMCGLLHMCQPLELRFLGSYLEDLARKDYHVLRDFECRANNPSDLGVLTDVIDPVVRSKLLVFLSLLGSDSRECAGILSRILSSVDLALFYRNYDHSRASFRDTHLHPFYQPYPDRNLYRSEQSCNLPANEPAAGALEQLALLFTMASLHPAFHFHQREVVRGQLDKIELAMEEERGQKELKLPPQTTELVSKQVDFQLSSVQGFGECAASHSPCQSRCSSRWATPREAVHIERLVLRGISQTGTDREYNFEVKWSDSSSSSVTKTHHELENFLLKLPKDQSTESFEKSILRLLSQGDQYESREVEKNLRERFMSAPPVFRKTRKVCSFFTCDSTYFCKPTCSRYSYVKGHKKKQGSKSPCQLLSSAKFPQGDTRRGAHAVELNGPAERRKKSSTLRSSQEAEQHHSSEKRSHPVSKMKNRVLPSDRDKGNAKVHGSAFVSNGSLVQALSPHRKGGCSGPDTCGETSSESYSSPSSPQHQGPESLDSEDDNNKDTDSHSDDCSKALTTDMFFTHQADPAVVGDHHLSSSNHKAQMETSSEFPSLSFMNSLPCVLPNGATESGLQMVSHLSQSVIPEGKQPGTLMMQMPLVPPRVAGEPEKRDVLPTFGIPSFGLHPQESLAVQPLVQRFKTVLSHSPGSTDGAPGSDSTPACAQVSHSHQTPARALGGMSSGPTSYSSLLPCQDPASVSPVLPSSLSHVDTSHAKHHCLTLPSGMPSPYSLPAVPTSVMPTVVAPVVPSAGHAQTAVPPAVPTHTPGPAPSLSPALTHCTAQSNSTSYSNTSASCGNSPVAPGNPITLQQTQQPTPPQQQQQPPIGCGACGCSNSCGSRGSGAAGGSGCPGPYIFSPQTGCVLPAAQPPPARPVFSPSFIQLCSNSYLTQTHPTHQANSAATLQPFYATAPPPAHPSSYLHSHSHTEVSSHMMGNQAAAAAAVAAVAAANYSIQQQMAPAASFCPRMYPQVYPNPMGMLPAANPGGGGVNKKNGNISCYNCGVSGHYAQDCNQPSIESTQQGGFRLKYAASHISETLDKAD